MFDDTDAPRVFALPPGADFPAELIAGLRTRMADRAPEAMARTEVIVNTQRMRRRLRGLFDNGPPMLLPKIRLLGDLAQGAHAADLPPPIHPLRRRFELVQLIALLLEKEPDLAPRTSLFDLADSLAALMGEMSGEGVAPEVIATLDVSDQSGHWARAQKFFGIVREFLDRFETAPDPETRQRRAVERLIAHWQDAPPQDPVIVAGSTGSRGTTALLMQAVARLPQGALILPGFDFDMPGSVWDRLSDALQGEDHPQYCFRKLLDVLDMDPGDVRPWTVKEPPNPARNRLISLALRPAPVTDQWLEEGPSLGDLSPAAQNVTLLEAPSMRIEALSIAMRLRKAAEEGQVAALITPDRMLTRQVSAALDRWNILPDDSAGTPLHLTPPGRFLRHVAALFQRKLTSETLLTLLKHPLTHSGGGRGEHLRLTRELELTIRRKGWIYPRPESLITWAAERDDGSENWAEWVASCFCDRQEPAAVSLEMRVDQLLALSERIAGAGGDGPCELWQEGAGREAQEVMTALRENAAYAGELNAADFTDLLGAVLSGGEVRDRDAPHPRILIWGTLEARVQGADLVILGGLNEGGWPESTPPDPWLNRAMRDRAGLLLPERRIGLAAHDFQQAIGAQEVWLTRSIRSEDAETVPSRWLNRLCNLMNGLPQQGGARALEDMRDRGQVWLDHANTLEKADDVPAVKRPSPCPPIAARPRKLSVTAIKRLIRDPYAIYAREVLRLKPLDPLLKTPDALLRGIVVHDLLERFVRQGTDDPDRLTQMALVDLSDKVLAENVPWPSARALWKARIERVSRHFVDTEIARQAEATPIAYEQGARAVIDSLGFTLTAKADRIDRDHSGRLIIYDYKTGNPPTKAQQKAFDKQLLLEAAMAEQGAFDGIDPAPVARAVYIGLGTAPKDVPAPLDTIPTETVWAEFQHLIAAYLQPDQGFTSRRAMEKDSDKGDYDQLARFGEWEAADPSMPETLR
ncbi:double-strand break repair protein AddB [Salinihabitans flavidus]|uniref:Double-strand break repair protein AddB n=1 Tax=Salinihabitans flavidus TaxID=569882 RepID=A0A1H8M0S9_9RHOB|nr:double-strand break repair protein AddB [Salinihabitans flavidus]SEO10746.1 double-strand break repair protein AddB [Salinihabitans flavidus]